MRSRKVLVGLACLAANAMLLDTAHADRRTGLSGNILIQDPDDLFPFPQYTLTHRNMLRLDYGPSAPATSPVGTSGNGVLTLGNEDMAMGVALHRGDILSPDVVGQGQELAWLGGVGNPFANNDFLGPDGDPVLPATVLDVSYGRRMGDNLIGMRLGFGRGVESVDVDGDKQKGAQTFIALQFGYSLLPPEGLKLDLSGNIVFARGKGTAGNGDDLNSGTDLHVGLLGRGYYPINEVVDLGFLGNVQIDNESGSDDVTDDGNNDFSAGLMAGVGPSINLERAKVAAYGGLALGFGAADPSDDTDDDEIGTIGLAAPMFNMAAEVQLLDWMYVRTGAQYTWDLARASTTPGGVDTVNKETGSTFGWTAGLGVTKNNFYFDGVVTNGFVTGGPNFIGGTSPGFLAMASVTYKFGDVLSGGAAAPAAEPAPAPAAPAPEPAPEVVPDQEAAAPAAEAEATGEATAGEGAASASGSAGISIGTKP